MKNEVDEFEWDDPRAFEFVFEPKVETDTPLKALLVAKPVKKGNKNRVKGNNFEYRVIKYLKQLGWFVERRGRSRFPDLFAYKKAVGIFFEIFEIECKNRKTYPKYIFNVLTKDEKERAIDIIKSGRKFVLAYNDKLNRKNGIIRLIEPKISDLT